MNEPRCAGFFLEGKDESVGRRGDSGELAARPVDAVAATRWVTLVARDFSTAPFWELSAARRVAALAAMRPVALVARDFFGQRPSGNCQLRAGLLPWRQCARLPW